MSSTVPRLNLASRIAASVIGGWAFVWGFVMLGIALLLAAGMSFDDARTLAYLTAFLVYLAAFCWSYAAASVIRVWLVLGGGAVVMTTLGWWLTRLAAT